MRESEQLALYFLVGERDDGPGKRLYVGQSGDVRKRLAAHNKEKDFWEKVLVLTTRTESLTSTHALFLESLFIQEAKRVGRYETENANEGMRSHTPPPLVADCLEIFETSRALLACLGHLAFEPLTKLTSDPTSSLRYPRGLRILHNMRCTLRCGAFLRFGAESSNGAEVQPARLSDLLRARA